MAEEILLADREMAALTELAPLTEQFLSYYRWKAGQLGDDADFFEWYAYCESHRRVTQKILKLGEKLYAVLSDLLSRPVLGLTATCG